MKLPFVSREQYDGVSGDLEFSRLMLREAMSDGAEWKELYHSERAKNEALNERLLSLKMAGAVEVPKPLAPPVSVPRGTLERDELKELIGEKCGTDSRKRGMMLRALAADRANKVPEDTIRALIENGIVGEGVPI